MSISRMIRTCHAFLSLSVLVACSGMAAREDARVVVREDSFDLAGQVGSVPVGRLNIEEKDLPTLQQMKELSRSEGSSWFEGEERDRLRLNVVREAALSYGARGGLAWGSREINRRLMLRSSELSRAFDFSRLLIRDARGAMLLPPVVSEARETMEQQEDGKVLRVADVYYEIISPARFVPNAPLWHGYLIRTYSSPAPPPADLLPRNERERNVWRRSVEEGWEAGLEQAEQIFEEDARRLERDYQGMVRYATLLRERKISAPFVAMASHGVTGTPQLVRVNDRTYRITSDAALNLDHRVWRAFPSGMTPEEGVRSRHGQR